MSPWNVAAPGVAPDLRWQQPTGSLTLASGEVHVWRVQLDQPAPRLDPFTAMLSDEEHLRAGRYHFARDRHRFILRRGFLRVILGHYLGHDPGQLQFTDGPHGKPALSFPAESGLQFNLSHSEGLALYAVTRDGGIGIDVERVRVIREAELIATHFFPAPEVAAWRSLPDRQRPEAFLKCWTCLEARVKANGRGMAAAPNPIRFPLAHETPSTLNRLKNPEDAANLPYDFMPAPGYVAALACQDFSSAEANPENALV